MTRGVVRAEQDMKRADRERNLRVRVVLTVTVDAAAYRAEYGEPRATIATVREYVRTAAQDAAQSALAIVGADVSLAY